MSRRPAAITQADVARVIRAAKQAGAARVEVCLGGVPVIIHLCTDDEKAVEPQEQIRL
jgi:hypothetical protein